MSNRLTLHGSGQAIIASFKVKLFAAAAFCRYAADSLGGRNRKLACLHLELSQLRIVK